MSEYIRLNKYLAHRLGISRRLADQKIENGQVRVNNTVAMLGRTIQTDRDVITIDSNVITPHVKRYTYLLVNKPVGYVCSRRQQGESPTIYKLLPRQYQHLKVAGRLDKDSCGLVLLTDDGDTIFKLTHPKFGKQKTYQVGLNKPLTSEDKKKIESGVMLEDGASKFLVSVIPAKAGISKKPNLYKVVMSEGRNRQIRRTFKALGYTVTHLERVQLGKYKVGSLLPSQYRTNF